MRPDERLPMNRMESRGSRVPPAVTTTSRPSSDRDRSQQRLDARDDLGRLGHPPDTHLALRELPARRADDLDAAFPKQGQVRLCRRVLPHAGVHRRRDEHRAVVREHGLREDVVCEPVREACHRMRGEGGDRRRGRRAGGADRGRTSSFRRPGARASAANVSAATKRSAPRVGTGRTSWPAPIRRRMTSQAL